MLLFTIRRDLRLKGRRLIYPADADQFMASRRPAEGRAGLGRLLNLSDVVAGQGMETLVIITPNEPRGSLQPAVVRPGVVSPVESSDGSKRGRDLLS